MNPLNKYLLRILNEQINDSDKYNYHSTKHIRNIFVKCGYDIQKKSLSFNQFHNFLRWCNLRSILLKRREFGEVFYKLNLSKVEYYLKRFNEYG